MTKLKTIKFEDIKIPVTTDEFKENLRKYLLPFGTKDAVYVQGKYGVPISKIENRSGSGNLNNGVWFYKWIPALVMPPP